MLHPGGYKVPTNDDASAIKDRVLHVPAKYRDIGKVRKKNV